MASFRQKLDSNRILTIAILDTTSDKDLESKILSNVYSKFDNEFDNEGEVLLKLAKERQAVYCIHMLENDIHNGGLSQYYLNHYTANKNAELFEKTKELLNLVGATRLALVIQKADSMYISKGANLKYEAHLFDQLDKDSQFLLKDENITGLKIKFIKQNLHAFVDN